MGGFYRRVDPALTTTHDTDHATDFMAEEEPSSEVLRAASFLMREPDAIEKGMATCILISGVVFFVASSVAMVLFFRERNSFEIRARSPFLSLLTAMCFLGFIVTTVARRLPGTFYDLEVNIYAIFSAYFFFSGCIACCYASRTIRLLVLYNLKARKTAPWLMSERNHVIVCLLLGAASMAVPLYDMGQVNDGLFREVEYFLLITEHYWVFLFATQAVVLLLNPIAWFIDDLFGIGPELRVMVIVQVIIFVGARIAEEYAEPDLLRWVHGELVGFFTDMFMIFFSIISPVWRRLRHPLQSSDPKVVKALARRRTLGAQMRTSVGPTVGQASVSGTETIDTEGGHGSFFSTSTSSPTTLIMSAANSPGAWTYERVMLIPDAAAALEQFSRKALCQESFLFLRDATAYQAQGFDEVEAGHASVNERPDGGGGGVDGDEKSEGESTGHGAEGITEQFALFSKIVQEYIVDGAPNEINISWNDKRDILDVYTSENPEKMGFNELPATERRLVFAQAFVEVRYVLESNLMLKFVSTDEFVATLTAARQKPSSHLTL